MAPTSPRTTSLNAKREQCQTWCRIHGWVERAGAWDVNLSLERHAQATEDLREMRRRHADVARVAIGKAAERLNSVAADQLSISDAVKLLHLGVKVERLTLGEADLAALQVAGNTPPTQ